MFTYLAINVRNKIHVSTIEVTEVLQDTSNSSNNEDYYDNSNKKVYKYNYIVEGLDSEQLLRILEYTTNYLIITTQTDIDNLIKSKSKLLNDVEKNEVISHTEIISFKVGVNTEQILKNALIVYMESKGHCIDLRSSDNISNNQYIKLSPGVQRCLQVSIGQETLLSKLMNTSTNTGSDKLVKILSGDVIDTANSINRRHCCDFIRENYQMRKIIGNFSRLKQRIEYYEEVEIQSSLFESNFEKSIYSKKSLNENSIEKYKTFIIKLLNIYNDVDVYLSIKVTMKAFKESLEVSFHLLPYYIRRLGELLNEKTLIDIRDILISVININDNPRGIYENTLCYVIKDDQDDYLKLTRKIYLKRISQCIEMEKKIRDAGYEMGIIKNELIIKCPKGNIVRDMNLHLIKIGTAITEDIYTTRTIKKVNGIISDIINQIIEIEGRISKNVILKLEKYRQYLDEIKQVITEIDICMAFNLSLPYGINREIKENNLLYIKNTNNIMIPGSTKTSYYFPMNYFDDYINIISGNNMAGKTSYIRNMCHAIIMNQIGCHISCDKFHIPGFDEIYFINTINDIIHLDSALRSGVQDTLTQYYTPLRIVLIDEIQCSHEIQLALVNTLRSFKIFTLFITHDIRLMKLLKEEGIKIFTYENYQLQEGINMNSSALELCKKYFPDDFINKLQENLGNLQ